MNKKKTITRRDFIKKGSMAAIGSTLYFTYPDAIFPKSNKKTTVVLIRNENVLNSNGIASSRVVLEMLDTAVTTLYGEKKPVDAWRKIVQPHDIVGIKSNEWGRLPTPEQVENSIKKRVMDAGVPSKNIGIGDRSILNNNIFQKATALINTRPMRSHHWSGVGSLIKNYITFVRNKPSYHPDSCADLAKLWFLPLTRDKTRLNILVMLTPQFHGKGPHSFHPRYVWKYYGFIVGFDPVAVDATGVRIIQAKRREFFGENRQLNPSPKHVFLADTRHHLGTSDPGKINLIKIGYKKDIFI